MWGNCLQAEAVDMVGNWCCENGDVTVMMMERFGYGDSLV